VSTSDREEFLYHFKGGGYAAAGLRRTPAPVRFERLGRRRKGGPYRGGRPARPLRPLGATPRPVSGHVQDTRDPKTTVIDRERQLCRSAAQRQFRGLRAARRDTPDRYGMEEVRGSIPLSSTYVLLVPVVLSSLLRMDGS
jgi:hypothetical protein